MLQGAFSETAVVLVLAAALGFVGLRLRQPLIIAFLALGILAGPWGLNLVHDSRHLELLSGMGISLLLFLVGLKLDLHMMKTVGGVALLTGLGQVGVTFVVGCGVALAFGLPMMEAVYVALALTFSSTIIIVKLLTDKKEIDSLHGRVSVGVLILQDIVVIAVLVLLSAFAGPGHAAGAPVWESLLWVVGKGAAMLIALALVTRFVFPRLVGHIARSHEILVLFGLAWAVAVAASAELLGFSKELGAFLAGVSLAFTSYREELSARLATVRDFLLLFFFLELGAGLQVSSLGGQVGLAVVLAVFVMLAKPLVVMLIMGAMGYRRRTALLSGLTLGQISEFSFILMAMGASIGHVSEDAVGLVTLVGLTTIALSSYMIVYSERLYSLVAPALRVIERRGGYREAATRAAPSGKSVDVILVGLGRYGGDIARRLLEHQQRLVVVDFDPEVLGAWSSRGVSVMYANAEDPDIVWRLPLSSAHWVVSDIPDVAVGTTLARRLREAGYKGRVALAARRPEDTALCAAAGADLVLHPFSDAAIIAADALTSAIRHLDVTELPFELSEIRIRVDADAAGRSLSDLRIREATGAQVIAVSRAGKSHFDPGPDFVLYPGDHVVIMGDQAATEGAAALLSAQRPGGEESEEFEWLWVPVAPDGGWVGRSLRTLAFRSAYGVSVLAVERPDGVVGPPDADETLGLGYRLLVLGEPSDLARLTAASSAVT